MCGPRLRPLRALGRVRRWRGRRGRPDPRAYILRALAAWRRVRLARLGRESAFRILPRARTILPSHAVGTARELVEPAAHVIARHCPLGLCQPVRQMAHGRALLRPPHRCGHREASIPIRYFWKFASIWHLVHRHSLRPRRRRRRSSARALIPSAPARRPRGIRADISALTAGTRRAFLMPCSIQYRRFINLIGLIAHRRATRKRGDDAVSLAARLTAAPDCRLRMNSVARSRGDRRDLPSATYLVSMVRWPE